MKPARQRLNSEVVKRGYSDEEVANIYELARFALENGEIRRAETIVAGLVEVAPDFTPAWLCLAVIHTQSHAYDSAVNAAKQVLKVDPISDAALLLLVTCYLSTGDYNSAGTHLGEVGERVESGAVDNPNILRFYRAQLARFQAR